MVSLIRCTHQDKQGGANDQGDFRNPVDQMAPAPCANTRSDATQPQENTTHETNNRDPDRTGHAKYSAVALNGFRG